MDHSILDHPNFYLTPLAGIFILGIGAQWLAWRLRIPSILLLLATGFLVGPYYDFIEPDELFGNLLFPIVSLSVAVVLFEGSLGLRWSELKGAGRSLGNLLSIGVLANWVLITIAAYFLLGFAFPMALLLGAMLVVTGPTVVGPLLRHVRPTGRVSPIAKWEGIVVDPIGAVLAVLVFEVIEPLDSAHLSEAFGAASIGLAKTVAVGALLGGGLAWLTAVMLKRHWIPDHLQSPMALLVVFAAFLWSNLLQEESGLLTVTVMGVLLANWNELDVSRILQFKENLTVLLISVLFILLSARVEMDDFLNLGWGGPLFVLAVILIARPASVFLATMKTGLTWQEKTFLAWLAPRGIVAAAVASVFALQLDEAGDDKLVSATFLVIVGTVVVYGLTAFPLARRLGLATADPQGLVIASAHAGARAIAHALQQEGFAVLLVDTNHANIQAARMEGLSTYYANILSERATEDLDLGGMGRFLALTSNDEVNALSCMHFREVFGRAAVYQLAPGEESARQAIAKHYLLGRFLFSESANYKALDDRFAAGAVVKTTLLTQDFDFDAFCARYGESTLPLFTILESGKLIVGSTDGKLAPEPGRKIVALVDAPAAAETADAQTQAS